MDTAALHLQLLLPLEPFGEWRMVIGEWIPLPCHLPLLLPLGALMHWLLAIGFWLLAVRPSICLW